MQFIVRRARLIGNFENAGGIITPTAGVDLARSFNGSSDFISCGHNNSFLAPTAISVAAWVNPSALTPTYSAIASRNDGAGRFYQMFIKSTGKAAFYAAGNSTVDVDPGSHSISTSTWTHIGMSYDSVNGLLTYVGGISDGTAAANGQLQTGFGTQDLTLGQDLINAGRFFAGAMADFALWNTTITPTQFANLASGQRANTIGSSANLVAYLPIVGQSPEPDKTGNSNNGVLTGTSIVAGPPTLQPF
jgi:hypothetical protein